MSDEAATPEQNPDPVLKPRVSIEPDFLWNGMPLPVRSGRDLQESFKIVQNGEFYRDVNFDLDWNGISGPEGQKWAIDLSADAVRPPTFGSLRVGDFVTIVPCRFAPEDLLAGSTVATLTRDPLEGSVKVLNASTKRPVDFLVDGRVVAIGEAIVDNIEIHYRPFFRCRVKDFSWKRGDYNDRMPWQLSLEEI